MGAVPAVTFTGRPISGSMATVLALAGVFGTARRSNRPTFWEPEASRKGPPVSRRALASAAPVLSASSHSAAAVTPRWHPA